MLIDFESKAGGGGHLTVKLLSYQLCTQKFLSGEECCAVTPGLKATLEMETGGKAIMSPCCYSAAMVRCFAQSCTQRIQPVCNYSCHVVNMMIVIGGK